MTQAIKTGQFGSESALYEPVYKDSASAGTARIHVFPGARQRRRRRRPIQDLSGRQSARVRLTRTQMAVLAGLVMALLAGLILTPALVGAALYGLIWLIFAGNATLRLLAACTKPANSKTPFLHPRLLPRYTVMVALYREADIAAQVLEAMLALRYPRDRLEILFVLESDDAPTQAAFSVLNLPSYARVIVAPPGFPRTKPRALNHALTEARGDLVVVYDAEDRPDPGQLLEAARAFAAGSPRLICLQAPLRPSGAQSFVARQFAAEYAMQFDVILPAMARLGLPFPLGGTSNHFKAEALKKLGGWDAFNVTEDADLGLRLAAEGYDSGLIRSPTREAPTATSRDWVPQRTRWIKGYMQTLLVHTRKAHGDARVWAGLGLGVGMSVIAAMAYAPLSVMMLANMLVFGLQVMGDPTHEALLPALANLGLFIFGNAAALAALAIGARRAGLNLRALDLAGAPVYWAMQGAAAAFALYQLLARPYHWDKTEHQPDQTNPVPVCSALAAE